MASNIQIKLYNAITVRTIIWQHMQQEAQLLLWRVDRTNLHQKASKCKRNFVLAYITCKCKRELFASN